jgi:hypothetical protein
VLRTLVVMRITIENVAQPFEPEAVEPCACFALRLCDSRSVKPLGHAHLARKSD